MVKVLQKSSLHFIRKNHQCPSMERKSRISILISGQGSNLQALIDAQTTTLKDSIIVRVGSNRKAAFGLVRAEERKIPTLYHNVGFFSTSTVQYCD